MGDSVAPTKHLSVFISYAKQDEGIADYVQNSLNRAGYRASTFTTSITPGDRWISSINQSLENVDVVVILLSKAATDSPWVLYEISASIASAERGSGQQVIPVALGRDVHPSGVLAQYQWIITSGEPREVANLIMKALEVPRRPNKAQEREDAWKNLGVAQTVFDEELQRWAIVKVMRDRRFTRLLLYLSALLGLIFVVAVIYLAASGNASPILVTAAVGGVSVITGTLGYVFGRAGLGARDDRPHK